MTGVSTPSPSTNSENIGILCSKSGDERSEKLKDGYARLRRLYPFVELTELPLAWSSKDKAVCISLTEHNLRVHYKGTGKAPKDAAAVRATHPIPTACLLYYYEIKIISKGLNGYMGIGLAAQGVNMQRLPGWDKQSYGYHGDDGHSFCSSGTGQPFGPTFTTDDIIGCAYNLVENTCFYTKNGLNLGTAFNDLPNLLYPTVGVQTQGEIVEANFGTEPFCYNIEEDIKALRQRITGSIIHYPVKYNEWQTTINKLVQSWLVHNGYCSTAEVFSSSTKQEFKENVQHLRQRLKIQKLILSGRIGDAIELTNRLYPTVLQDNPNLLFALKCRQFIEMMNDTEYEQNSFSLGKNQKVVTNGVSAGDCNGNSTNDEMEIDENDEKLLEDEVEEEYPCDDNKKLSRVILFGQELHTLSQQLSSQHGADEKNKKMLQDACSLLAYNDPINSPVGWQLHPSEREHVCQQLNNAIVNSELGPGSSSRPPLETIIKHSKALQRLNGQCGAWLIDKL